MTLPLPETKLEFDNSCYVYLPEYFQEQVLSGFLHCLLVFKKRLCAKRAMWRDYAKFLEQLALELKHFHMPEVQDRLANLLFDDCKQGNEQVR